MNQPVSLEALAAQQAAAPTTPPVASLTPSSVPGMPQYTPEQIAYFQWLSQQSAGAAGPVNPPEATVPVVAQSIAPVPTTIAPAGAGGPTPIGGAPVKAPSKAEIVAQLKARGIPHKSSQSKDELAALLANPPAAPLGPTPHVELPVAPVGAPVPAVDRSFDTTTQPTRAADFFHAYEALQHAASELDLTVEVTIRG